MKKKESVILPGSYDPVTLGHLDIIRRAAEEYEEVYVVAFQNPAKCYTYSTEDRVKMLMLATDDIENCIVSYSNGLVIDYMREHGIDKIIKGYRNDTDYEYETEQARWNLKRGGYPTELIKCREEYAKISSSDARWRILEELPLDDILPKSVIDFIYRH